MNNNNSVRLVFFLIDHLDALHAFELPEEQRQFTALPNVIRAYLVSVTFSLLSMINR